MSRVWVEKKVNEGEGVLYEVPVLRYRISTRSDPSLLAFRRPYRVTSDEVSFPATDLQGFSCLKGWNSILEPSPWGMSGV
jgi:hypothetical protein